MEATLEQPKIRKSRTKKPVFPHVEAARKAMSKALKTELQWRLTRDRKAKELTKAEIKLRELTEQTAQAWSALAVAAQEAAQVTLARNQTTA